MLMLSFRIIFKNYYILINFEVSKTSQLIMYHLLLTISDTQFNWNSSLWMSDGPK
jgi:hypothetical protein